MKRLFFAFGRGGSSGPACGGTTRSWDETAPTTIRSKEMTLFDVTSVLPYSRNCQTQPDTALGYVSAFAAPAGQNTFLFLETSNQCRSRQPRDRSWALIRENLFPALVCLTEECAFAQNNGKRSFTAGLPENFGGEIRIRYASGEAIDVSNNQSPVLSRESGQRIADLFREAFRKEPADLPDPDSLQAIRYLENRDQGCFTRALLTLHPDGTGTIRHSSLYPDSPLFEREETLDPELIRSIKSDLSLYGILAWEQLPVRPDPLNADRTLTFLFSDGSEHTVPAGCIIPSQFSDGFFRVQLELTRRHS